MSFTKEEALQSCLEFTKGNTLKANTWVDKYLHKENEVLFYEKSPIDRIANIAHVLAHESSLINEQEVIHLMTEGKLYPGGSSMEGLGTTTLTSLANCMVIDSPHDSVSGIMDAGKHAANAFKARGGVGMDISPLRPKKALVRNAAKTSSGAASFVPLFAQVVASICQEGRRGAELLSIHIRHPDALLFAQSKMQLDKNSAVNISLRVDDEFMRAVRDDLEYTQQWPVDSDEPKFTKQIKARELFNQIVELARTTGDPGILFWDRIIDYTPKSCYSDFRPISTNPCLTGDTIIPTGSGNKTFKELAEKGDDIEVECWDFKNKKVATRIMRNPRKTGNQEIMEVVFEGRIPNERAGDFFEEGSLRCTLDHKFFLLGTGDEIKAKDLRPGMKIMGGNVFEDNFNEMGVIIKSTLFLNECEDVYNGTVDDFHNYAILSCNLIILSRNCGELPLAAASSCRLLSLNLAAFANWNGFFDWVGFRRAVQVAVLVLDAIVDIDIHRLQLILDKATKDNDKAMIDVWAEFIRKAKAGREIGLGTLGLGTLFFKMGCKYGDPESIKLTELIGKTLAVTAYQTSMDMAEELGAFPAYDVEAERGNLYLEFLKRDTGLDVYSPRRHVALLTNAPTGSLGILAGVSSGMEPVAFIEGLRRVKILNDAEKPDSIDPDGNKFKHYPVYDGASEEWKLLNPDQPFPAYFVDMYGINHIEKIGIQATLQKYIDNSISNTMNLLKNATSSTIYDIYMEAWSTGCKGSTIYVDGSKGNILVKKEDLSPFKPTEPTKRPKSLECDIHSTTIKGEKWAIFVGKLDNKPYEVFAGLAEHTTIPKSCITGKIVKRVIKGEGSVYDLVGYTGSEEILLVTDIVNTFKNTKHGAMGRMISLSLRLGGRSSYVTEQLFKEDDPDFMTYNKIVGRILKKYIDNGELPESHSDRICTECGQESIIYEEGCMKCSQCGYSKCG